MQPGECPELWCIEHADDVRDIAKMYVDAGADIVMTDSFGGSRFKLEHYGLAGRVSELNEAAARLSREAIRDQGYVMASVGSTGKLLMMGDVTEEELYDAFKEQMVALERGGADAVVVETMSALDEACAAIRAAKENTGLVVLTTFAFDTKTPQGYRTMMGVSPEQMAEAALEAGADAVGANCALGSDEMVMIAEALRAAAPGTPIIVQPNAGRPIPREDGSNDYPETPEMFAANVPRLVEAGASIIGGCCGTRPEHIRAIRAAIDAL
jgi:5-methyltetrahydrofolate--homocysteine methyltransferase